MVPSPWMALMLASALVGSGESQINNACLDPESSEYRCQEGVHTIDMAERERPYTSESTPSSEIENSFYDDDTNFFRRPCGFLEEADLPDLLACFASVGPTLEILHLQTEALKTGMFTDLSILKEMSIRGDTLTALEEGLFDGAATTLESLKILISQELETIQPNVFVNLENLKTLEIITGQVTEYSSGVFNGLSNLVELNLGNQRDLRVLAEDLFEPLTSLERLDLRGSEGVGCIPASTAETVLTTNQAREAGYPECGSSDDIGPSGEFIGCFDDMRDDRIMGDFVESSNNMNASVCQAICEEDEFVYYGTQFGKECFCSNDDDFDRHGSSSCSMFCSGDNRQICGDVFKMSVYTTGIERSLDLSNVQDGGGDSLIGAGEEEDEAESSMAASVVFAQGGGFTAAAVAASVVGAMLFGL